MSIRSDVNSQEALQALVKFAMKTIDNWVESEQHFFKYIGQEKECPVKNEDRYKYQKFILDLGERVQAGLAKQGEEI